MQFRTTILSGGKTAAGIEIPVAIVDALGTSRKPDGGRHRVEYRPNRFG